MVGIDIVEVSRIGRLKDRYGDKFLAKVFTDDEIRYARSKRRGDESLAGRFAAKEAFMKARGRRLPWKSIEVSPGTGAGPLSSLKARCSRGSASPTRARTQYRWSS